MGVSYLSIVDFILSRSYWELISQFTKGGEGTAAISVVNVFYEYIDVTRSEIVIKI